MGLFCIFFANRYSDIWIYGVQIIHVTLFFIAFVFGSTTAYLISFLALALVAKFKPYRFNGTIINAVSYIFLIIPTVYLSKMYGASISLFQLKFYGMLIIVLSNYILTMPLQMKLTPSHWSSFINRILWFMTDYTVLNAFGLEIIRYLFSLK